MNRKAAMVFGTATILAAIIIGVGLNQKQGKLPDSVFDKMEFPADEILERMDGDEHGVMCQPIYLVTADGTTMIAWHKLWKHDFRKMTVAQKKAALIQGAKDAVRETNFACTDPAGGRLLSEAYAQPHCQDCGGGCGTKVCPGTIVVGGGCVFGGTTCAITFVCCSGSCACG